MFEQSLSGSLGYSRISQIEKICFQFLFEQFGVKDQSNVDGQTVPGCWCRSGKRSLGRNHSWSRNDQIMPSCWTERSVTWDVSHRCDQLCQIWRCSAIDRMVNQETEFAIGNQWSSYSAGVTWSRGPKSTTIRAAALMTLWSCANVEMWLRCGCDVVAVSLWCCCGVIAVCS